jgi:glycosyltransferase involved in cell wall biosynthesis
VIVTSRTTAATLAHDFGVPEARLTVAEPGVGRPPTQAAIRDPWHLLAVGSVSPRKAYDVLIGALAVLPEAPPWRLTIAGALDRAGTTYDDLQAQVARLGFTDRVVFTGALDEPSLSALYAGAGLFVMSSHYEGYGMVIAEALAAGLPIVSTTGGALAETVPDTAALKVAAGDGAALGRAIRRVLEDDALRDRLAAGAVQAAAGLPTWDDTATTILHALESVAPEAVTRQKGFSA